LTIKSTSHTWRETFKPEPTHRWVNS